MIEPSVIKMNNKFLYYAKHTVKLAKLLISNLSPFIINIFSIQIMSTPLPIRGGRHNCFIAVGASVGVTPITKGPLLKFFGSACFLFARSVCFDICYDLDIWLKVKL